MGTGKKILTIVLVAVLAAAFLGLVACGEDEQAKEELRAALDKFDQDVAELTKTFTSGGTVPDVKKAKDAYAPDWQAVIAAAEKVKGAKDYVQAAKDAWAKVDAAISALPDDAALATVGMSLLPAVQELQKVAAELRQVVGEAKK